MASADNFHSQLVSWSKIILPICGIGLLSTLFLFAPVDPNSFSASDLSLTLNAADGSEVRITATTGEIDGTAKVARLRGLARLETSNGYTMETNGLVADLESGTIISDGALEIRAPFGAITAGRVTFETANDAKGRQMLFTQDVRLVYTPNSVDSKDATE
jgi:lipopolysaccharide export system protein LptC